MTQRRSPQTPEAVSWNLTGSDPLSQVLAAAAAPAHADELAGLPDALTAFSQASPSPRRHPVLATLAKLAAAKALVALTAGAAVGGVALAAATNTLPAPAQQVVHDAVGAPAPDADKNADKKDKKEKTDDAKGTESAASPTPNLVGLCRAYTAGVATSHGKALENPAFTYLITSAGSKDGVAGYCTALLAAHPTGKPATAGKPTTSTHGKPTTATHGKPAKPGRSTTHP
jgi:hypothetical protein